MSMSVYCTILPLCTTCPPPSPGLSDIPPALYVCDALIHTSTYSVMSLKTSTFDYCNKKGWRRGERSVGRGQAEEGFYLMDTFLHPKYPKKKVTT